MITHDIIITKRTPPPPRCAAVGVACVGGCGCCVATAPRPITHPTPLPHPLHRQRHPLPPLPGSRWVVGVVYFIYIYKLYIFIYFIIMIHLLYINDNDGNGDTLV